MVGGSRFEVAPFTTPNLNRQSAFYAALNTTFKHSSCLLLNIA
jgi:hypothetical protein